MVWVLFLFLAYMLYDMYEPVFDRLSTGEFVMWYNYKAQKGNRKIVYLDFKKR